MKLEQETIYITTDFIKLDSLLKFAGMTETGGLAKAIVEEGLVSVNGMVCTQRGRKLHPGDVVRVEHYELTVARRQDHAD